MDEADLEKEFEKERKKGILKKIKGSFSDVKELGKTVKTQLELARQIGDLPNQLQKSFKELETLSKNPTEENQRTIEELFTQTERMFDTLKSVPHTAGMIEPVEKEYFAHKAQYYDSLKAMKGVDISECDEVCEHEFELESPKRKGYSNRIFLLDVQHANLGIVKNLTTGQYEIQDVNIKDRVVFSGTLGDVVDKANELEGRSNIKVGCGEACPQKTA